MDCEDMRKIVFGLSCALGFQLLNACGSAATDEIGRCKAVDDAKYVAARTDTDGNAWKFELVPDKVEVRCNGSSEEGFVTISGLITDSLGSAKAGLVVRPQLSGSGKGLSVLTDGSDINTDACGVAIFTLKWECPSANKEVSGAFVALSGPLSSNPVQVTVSNVVITSAQSASSNNSGNSPTSGTPNSSGGTSSPDTPVPTPTD